MTKLYKINSKAFTLIEMMIVVTIIGIISAIVFASFDKAREKSRNATREASIEQINLALTVYRNVYGSYPEGINGSVGVLSVLVDTNLIEKILDDPNGDGSFPVWDGSSSDLNSYYYWNATSSPSGCNTSTKYVLWYNLENKDDGNATGACHINNNSYVIVR